MAGGSAASEQGIAVRAAASDSWLFRVAGIGAVGFAGAYVAIFALYATVGAPPHDAQAWLTYAAGRTGTWWWIVALSVLTDLLLVPIGLALYRDLGHVQRDATLLGVSAIWLFVVLDLAVTWPNITALLTLTDAFAAVTGEAQRAALVAAAAYPAAVLASTLAAVYSIALLSLGLLILGLLMRRSGETLTAWVGVATGVLGLASVFGPLVVPGLGIVVIGASVLTTLWALLVGRRLLRLASDVTRAA